MRPQPNSRAPALEPDPKGSPDPRLAEHIRRASERQEELRSALAGRRARLPLRYWRQHAHFTTPAADEQMARKALEQGTAPMVRILERLGLTGRELADRLAVDEAVVEELLARPRPAPLVMLDGEDAQALRDDVTERGLEVAATLLRDRPADDQGHGSLRFFRPPGFNLPSSAHDLYTVLWRIGGESIFPLDGIVFPKVEHPEEVALLYELLDEAEDALGLPRGQVRVAFLIESGWAAARLAEIAGVAAPRLCSLIFGLADYSADLGLPEISGDHPLAEWARAEIVNVAGAVGVPAIDAMTLAYPVGDPALDPQANRARFLDRMALVYDDAVRARKLGMLGKWVGHPAQLFAVLLAFGASLGPEALEAEASKLAAYRAVVDDEARGATMIGGIMSDRATDRHARAVLRQAVAVGRFPADRALALGIIEPDEVEEARRIGDEVVAADRGTG